MSPRVVQLPVSLSFLLLFIKVMKVIVQAILPAAHQTPAVLQTQRRVSDAHVQHVYILSTVDQRRLAKAREIQIQLLANGVEKSSIFISTSRESGHKGCWLGHKQIAQQALRKGQSSVIILEDDVELSDAFLKNFASMNESISASPSWSVFYFGHNPEMMSIPEPAGGLANFEGYKMVRLKSWSTVAYAARKEILHALEISSFESLPDGTVDGVLRQFPALGFFPMLASHPENWSNTVHKQRRIYWRVQEMLLFNLALTCSTRCARINDLNSLQMGRGVVECVDSSQLTALGAP